MPLSKRRLLLSSTFAFLLLLLQCERSASFVPQTTRLSSRRRIVTPVLQQVSRNEGDSDEPAADKNLFDLLKENLKFGKRPPDPKVEDFQLLFYDVFLLINLALSISFWDVHRLDLSFVGAAFNEGCLLSICWMLSGLYYGAFLNSAVDGHYGSADERGGPKAAGLLALSTFIGTINLRLIFSLIIALAQHRPVGSIGGELFIPTEVAFGLVLMTAWRVLHSSMVPRI